MSFPPFGRNHPNSWWIIKKIFLWWLTRGRCNTRSNNGFDTRKLNWVRMELVQVILSGQNLKGTIFNNILTIAGMHQLNHTLYYISKPGKPFSCVTFTLSSILYILSDTSYTCVNFAIPEVHFPNSWLILSWYMNFGLSRIGLVKHITLYQLIKHVKGPLR